MVSIPNSRYYLKINQRIDCWPFQTNRTSVYRVRAVQSQKYENLLVPEDEQYFRNTIVTDNMAVASTQSLRYLLTISRGSDCWLFQPNCATIYCVRAIQSQNMKICVYCKTNNTFEK